MIKETVLIVDDEQGNRKAWMRLLSSSVENFVEASDGLEALAKVRGGLKPAVIILDLMMPRMDGLDFLRTVRSENLESGSVLVCSANHEISKAIECMQLGAADYIEKPVEALVMQQRVRNLLSQWRLKNQNEMLKQELRDGMKRRLLGNSIIMQNTLVSIERLAHSPSTVLVHGESGTGKELVARALHDFGPRASSPFMVVDCAAVHGHTIESELFGHERGAYTGADQKSEGLLLAAKDGTIFFDEIGELPMDLQAKLLRVLQERQVRPLGSTFYKPMAARVVAATNRDLLAEVKAGRFREDLYYRLSIVQLRMPPLRERREDIPLLVSHFLYKYSSDYGMREFTMDLQQVLQQAPWPGNIRQLENTVQSLLATTPKGENLIGVDSLQDSSIVSHVSMEMSQQPVSQNPMMTMREIERLAIVRALDYTNGNRRVTAELLGIGEATLYRKIKEYEL